MCSSDLESVEEALEKGEKVQLAGYGRSIASFITNKLGKDKAILAIVLSGAFLTYGGVSLFVVAFILYPASSINFAKIAPVKNSGK